MPAAVFRYPKAGHEVESPESDARGGFVAVQLGGADATDQVLRATGTMPRSITVDNGTEFTSRAFEDWAYSHGAQIDLIYSGTPLDNAFIRKLQRSLARRVPERASIRYRSPYDRPRDGRLIVDASTGSWPAMPQILTQ